MAEIYRNTNCMRKSPAQSPRASSPRKTPDVLAMQPTPQSGQQITNYATEALAGCSSFPLLDLPFELISQVLTHLDSFSLRDLLRASPAIAQRCIVLYQSSDRGNNFPCFFYDDQIPHMLLGQFSPGGKRFLLKIYEVHLPLAYRYDYRYNRPPETRFSIDLPYVSSIDSHVHCYIGDIDGGIISNHKTLFVHLASRYLLEQGVSFQIDRYRDPHLHITEQCDVSTHRIRDICASTSPSYQRIRFLSIENCRFIKDLTLPQIYSLTVVLPRTTSVAERPIISSLEMPTLQCFLLYYDDIPPMIEHIHFPGVGYTVCSTLGQLLLCHRPSVKSNLVSPLPSLSPEIEALYDFSELNSNKTFTTVTVIGGPDIVLNQLHMANVDTLSWRQTMLQRNPLLEIPQSFSLRKFSFETLLPNAVFPELQVRYIPTTLAIISHHGISISNLTEKTLPDLKSKWNRRILIHCYNSTGKSQRTPRLSELPLLWKDAVNPVSFLSIDGLIDDHSTTSLYQSRFNSHFSRDTMLISATPFKLIVDGHFGLYDEVCLNYYEVRNF